jgi:hypothetical protein
MPLFEAVVNSVHSIEESKIGIENGKIRIEIIRKNEPSLGLGAGREHLYSYNSTLHLWLNNRL